MLRHRHFCKLTSLKRKACVGIFLFYENRYVHSIIQERNENQPYLIFSISDVDLKLLHGVSLQVSHYTLSFFFIFVVLSRCLVRNVLLIISHASPFRHSVSFTFNVVLIYSYSLICENVELTDHIVNMYFISYVNAFAVEMQAYIGKEK